MLSNNFGIKFLRNIIPPAFVERYFMINYIPGIFIANFGDNAFSLLTIQLEC